jgi:hypothetical protein
MSKSTKVPINMEEEKITLSKNLGIVDKRFNELKDGAKYDMTLGGGKLTPRTIERGMQFMEYAKNERDRQIAVFGTPSPRFDEIGAEFLKLDKDYNININNNQTSPPKMDGNKNEQYKDTTAPPPKEYEPTPNNALETKNTLQPSSAPTNAPTSAPTNAPTSAPSGGESKKWDESTKIILGVGVIAVLVILMSKK